MPLTVDLVSLSLGVRQACVVRDGGVDGVAFSQAGVSRKWGDEDGSDMTGRAVSGWGIADEMGLAVGRNVGR
jgi:hypothetical protein